MKPSYEELEQKLEESQHEFRSADITMQNLEAKCEKLAAENAGLLPKAASELSNAWVLHKYLIGIQAAIMYLDNGNKKAAQEWLYGTIAGPGFEFPDGVDDIDAWATHQMRGSVSHQQALEIIKAETPATDAFLAEVRAQGRNEGINYAAGRLAAAFNHGFVDKPLTEVCDVVRMILDTKEEMANSTLPAADGLSGEYPEKFLEDSAAQLRKGVQS
ncbi:TPA: hypothetical protein ACGZ2M_000240 [Citrobacter farmeri]